MYQNRNNIGKFWPIPRKGTKYLAVSSHNKRESIPLIVVLRDVLKTVRTKKELRKALNEKQILINGKEIRETNYPVSLFDVLSVGNKNYRATLSKHKKTMFEEISDKESSAKTIKVIGKKLIKGNNVQVNLLYGGNVIIKDEVNVDDSIVLNFKNNKVERIIKMEKGKTAYVIKGRHTGEKGKIESIEEIGGRKIAKIDSDKKVNVWIKNIIVME